MDKTVRTHALLSWRTSVFCPLFLPVMKSTNGPASAGPQTATSGEIIEMSRPSSMLRPVARIWRDKYGSKHPAAEKKEKNIRLNYARK